MEGNSANFTFDNHPVIATLRMKGVVKPKSWSGEHSDSSEQEKYSETQLHQIFNKLELSSSMVGAFNGIPYFRHFDAPHLQKLITVNVSFPPEIIQTIPYYILHAAVSFCFDLEESYSSSNLVLVLRSLIFLCCRSQLATAENMFYFLLKFSSVNALSLETRPILDLVENLIKIKNRADPRLISALIFWASNTRSNGLIPSKSEEKIKTTGAFLQRFSSLDEDTKLVLSYTDELLKRYTDCITPDDASLLFARIEKPIRSLEPFGISMFCTIFKHLPNELLINFYKQIPQNIVDFMNREIPVTRYKRVDEKTLKEAEKVDVNKVPQIIHAFRKKLYFNYDVSYPEYKPYPAKTDPILETYNILVCSKSRELITSSLMKTFDVYGEKKRFYDFISCFLQLSDNCPYVVPFFQKLFDTDVFDPRITIFEEQTEETKKMLELRTLAFDKIAENKYICLSERISRFVPYPNISAEIFMRLTHTHYVNSQHYLDFPQIGLDYIPSYQEVHVSLNTKLDEASDEEKEAIKQKIKIVERCRLAMIEFFVETMSICECFEVYTQNDEFLSLFFSLSYEKQISDIVLDSVFAHFENPSDEFLKQIPDILAVLTTPHGDFTENNIALTTSILKRLCKIKEYETIGMEPIKRNILSSFEKENVQFTEEYLVYSIRFISLISSNYQLTNEDSAQLARAITKICGDEPWHSVQMELISLLAGKQLDALSTDFLIKQPYALPLLIRPFKNSSRLKGIISFIAQLCIFSTTNARQCQEGKLDLELLYLLLSRYHKLDANIDDPNEARLISETFSLISKISSIASSRTAVQKFITMFCPIEGKYVSPLLPQAVKAMKSILVNGHNIPSGFLPLTNREPYISISGLSKFDLSRGFTACFWVFIDSGSAKMETRIFSINDKAGNYITISLANLCIIVTINDEPHMFTQNLGKDEWIFFAVTIDKAKSGTSVKIFFKNVADVSPIQYKAFDFEMGAINCEIGKPRPNEKLDKNEHPILLGPFAIYQPIHDSITLNSMDNAGTHSSFDMSLFSLFFEVEGAVLTIKTKKEYSAEAKIIGPSVFQTPPFQDVFLRSYQVTSLIPLFAQANISEKVEVKPIINLIETVLAISNEAQGDFEKYSRFTIIAYLLKKFDIEIYTAFYEIFVKFQSNHNLQYQLVTEILANIKLLSLASPESQVLITTHWLDNILPLMKEKLKRKNDFRVSLHNTIEYFHKICDKARANVFKSLLFKASCQLKPNAFLELLAQCQKATDETKAYELLNLVKNIISLDVPLDRNELEQLMGIYEMLKLKSVRITLLLLDIFVILEEKELIKITLLLQIEIIKTKIPEEVLNEEFLVDVLKRAQKMPAFFPLACYALAVHPDKLQAVFIKNIPTVCDEYKRANKAWPFWPFIAAIICGGTTMNTILEFVLKASTKIWETVYVILEITSKLLNSTSTEPQRQFFTIMSTLVKENDPNELVFEKLCFTYIFTRKGQTHNKAIINEIVNSKLETFVDKSFLVEAKKEAEKFDVSLFNKFESRLLKLGRFQKFTYGLNMTAENKWEDYPLSYVLKLRSNDASTLINAFETRNKKYDPTYEIEQAIKNCQDEIDLVSIEFNRLCTFIGKFLEKATAKNAKFSMIRPCKIQEPIYQNVAAQWKTLWTQQTIESAPWSSSIIVREKHFMRDQIFCYAYCPMKLKENKHFTNHKDAAVMRDYGSAETAKEIIEAERKRLEEKYKNEAPPELLQVSRHRDSSEEGEHVPILYKYKGDIITLMHESPCVMNIFDTGIKIEVYGNKENESEITKVILVKNNSISRISYRAYLHHPTGLEIFCYDGRSYFINLKVESMTVLNQLHDADGWQKCSIQTEYAPKVIESIGIVEKWARGDETNFKYLMFLNRASGRTFNDASLYPVMPWVLCDYESTTLDLKDPKVFRDLSKPVGALGEQRLKEILGRKKDLEDFGLKFYMYSSFYVSPLCVYLWLMRMEPFTTLHTNLQSGKFDHAARLFTNVAETYKMVTSHLNDFRELIPEFYFCPHFLKNENDFDLGVIDDGKKINDVELPPWADNAFDFIYKMRKALESDYVSEHLNKWIDLIWGVSSQGEGAVKALNTFDPNMYESAWTEETLNNPQTRSLIEATMKHCGQLPMQLFFKEHISRKVNLDIRSDSFETGFKPISCSAINGKIVSIDDKGVISCYSQGNVEEVGRLSFHPEQNIPMTCFSGKVAVASPLGYIEIFDINKHVSLMKVCPHTCKSTCLSVSTRFVCSGGSDSTLYLFDHLMLNNGSIPLFRDEVVDCSISDTFHIAAAITKDSFLFIVDTTRVIVRQSMHLDDVPRIVSITPSWGFIVVVTGSTKGNEKISVYSSDGELLRQCKVSHLSRICTFQNRFGFDYICIADEKGSLKCVEAYYVDKLADSAKSYPVLGPLANLLYDSHRICAITKTGRCVQFTPDYLTQ